MGFKRHEDFDYQDGVIVALAHPQHFNVWLDDGRHIVALLPKSTIRRLGCLLGNLVGWRVVVKISDPPRIVDMTTPDSGASFET
ncbi:MAG: hypothetical protein AAF483_25500 [Planctomycetota bacterium]